MMELDDVGDALDLLAKVDWAGVPGDVAGQAVVEIDRLRAQLDAAEAAATAAFDRSMAWNADGSQSPSAWLAFRTHRPKGHHDRCRRRARELADMPYVADVFAEGLVSAEHVDVLGWARASRPAHFDEAERFLTDKAQQLTWRSFRFAVRRWMDVVDPNASDKDRRREHDGRYLHASASLNGMGRLDGWLDQMGFEAFRNALQRIVDELFEADWAAAVAEFGDATTLEHLCRTSPQRRADALVEMAHRAMTAPADGKRPLPLVNLVCDQATFEAALIRYFGGSADLPLEGQCRLLDGTPVRAADMIHQALLGHVRRMVFGADGVVVNASRKQRFFTGAVRDAILVTHSTCAHPTCEVPATRCEIDHVIEWQDGGDTDQENGKPRCWHHHHRWKRRRAGWHDP